MKQIWLQPNQIHEIKDFLLTTRRKLPIMWKSRGARMLSSSRCAAPSTCIPFTSSEKMNKLNQSLLPGSHSFNSYVIVFVMVYENSMLHLVFAGINHSCFLWASQCLGFLLFCLNWCHFFICNFDQLSAPVKIKFRSKYDWRFGLASSHRHVFLIN